MSSSIYHFSGPPVPYAEVTSSIMKDESPYFTLPYTTFRACPIRVQRSTVEYLRGVPVNDWPRQMGLPLMEMFRHLRCCVLLLLEDENPGLHVVLRDPECYEEFRDGLSPNFLTADDDEIVDYLRGHHPALDARLRCPGQRWRILLALRNVYFPFLMNPALQDGYMGEEEIGRVDPAVSGDTEITIT
ncbi:hypothetical protein F4680DRAFT_467087 [Xylaria scruposa]|nr:hypothetical protein F4680DRAFT_467087 [Xylaria scruposa]